jgi:hypothetical protein
VFVALDMVEMKDIYLGKFDALCLYNQGSKLIRYRIFAIACGYCISNWSIFQLGRDHVAEGMGNRLTSLRNSELL